MHLSRFGSASNNSPLRIQCCEISLSVPLMHFCWLHLLLCFLFLTSASLIYVDEFSSLSSCGGTSRLSDEAVSVFIRLAVSSPIPLAFDSHFLLILLAFTSFLHFHLSWSVPSFRVSIPVKCHVVYHRRQGAMLRCLSVCEQQEACTVTRP